MRGWAASTMAVGLSLVLLCASVSVAAAQSGVGEVRVAPIEAGEQTPSAGAPPGAEPRAGADRAEAADREDDEADADAGADTGAEVARDEAEESVEATDASAEAADEPAPTDERAGAPAGEAEAASEPARHEDVVDTLNAAIGRFGATLEPGREPHPRVRWDPSWPRYRFDELVLTVGMALVIGLEELLPTRSDPNWQAVTDLDLAVASTLGLSDPTARDALEEVSTGLATALFLWPVAIDSLLYAGAGEGAWDVAWQLSLISLEVFTVNHALTVLVRLLTRRERPLGRFCAREPGYDADPICADQPAAESFWSGHVSNAFAGAALVCLHHDVVDLFGDEVTDGLACGAALAAAAATGAFRIMADHHWITDVMTGAVVGSLSGALLPWLLHFAGGARPPLRGSEPPAMTFLITPMGGSGVFGLSATGAFF